MAAFVQSDMVKEGRAVLAAEHIVLEVQRRGLGDHVLEDLVHAHALPEGHQGEGHAAAF